MAHDHLRRACELVGGKAALARAIGVTPPAVHQWIRGMRPIPAERCPLIERATDGLVRCEDLRPDVDWSVLRARGRRAPAEEGEAA